MEWKEEYHKKLKTAAEAVKCVRSGDRVFIGAASSIAQSLADALYERMDELKGVTLSGALILTPQKCFEKSAKGHFSFSTFFMGPQERIGFENGVVEYCSIHLSRIDHWCRTVARPNIAFLDVSKPDDEGYVSFGATGPALFSSIIEACETIVLQVNDRTPYVYGQESRMHISEVDIIIETSHQQPFVRDSEPNDEEKAIASHIISQIPDGATIQLGIGRIAGAVGYGLGNHRDLGVHTELMTDSMKYLYEKGVITGRKKRLLPGKMTASFTFGSPELYDFLDRNNDMHFAPYTYVNNPYTIAQLDDFMSINTALMVDLTGQVYSESLGTTQYSGTGGQLDFVRGAQMSKGGKSFIALSSSVDSRKLGKTSRIVLSAPAGTAVTTPRTEVQYVVTEFGCVNLKDLTMQKRALALIELAHPDFREELIEQAVKSGLLVKG
ncbi:acetyl-CoA hydrolase/transferase family protein [Youngiibacter multivorans]|uniref:4-hydroxybutyrate CoA-transferase n=1 Tax=Youngiibacter multivorans TaxID=937251 RepID=A0ABS4FZA7_9CLOT|nr:acetyl-CoA hydrolase/transferase C-terminal domain-containing protein [Youngiibacter multivorans]MBP1917638.1 4-hydroxybutyrate CoA-transferase [Youngiibacter multivorans]